MSNRAHASSSRSDFAFPTSDQAGASQQSYGGFDVDHDANAPGASEIPLQAPVQDAQLRFQDFSVEQAQQLGAQFQNFGYTSNAPFTWDWTNNIDFADFTNQYEPQGELVQELQKHVATTNDFSTPLPITATDGAFQVPQPSSSAPPITNSHNLLSPPPKPPQRPAVQTGVKRKVDSEPTSAVSQGASEAQPNPPKRQNKSRQSSETSLTSPVVPPTPETRSVPMLQTSQSEPAPKTNTEVEKKKEPSKGTGPQGRVIDVSTPRRVAESQIRGEMLPAGKVFPIQIGSELFRLSGASISSDAPSYFSHFFGDQLHNNGGRAGDVRTLYIDRDPDTFRDIALHLQGYHITPKDGEHFVKLFADAQFYSLPRLTKQLFNTDIFIRIGGTPFQIPRDLFSAPGDSPNYFSLGFAQFFSTPSEVFPGLDRDALLRPPSISPPSAPNRDGATFGELVKILQGYNVEIRNEEHRSQLLRDARYFHLKGLEQRLIPCELSYNLKRQQSEILIRLEDIRQSGISFTPDKIPDSDSSTYSGAQSSLGLSPSASKAASPAPSATSASSMTRPGYVSYARPYTDDHARTNILILEISSQETTALFFPHSAPEAASPAASPTPTLNLRATFHNSTLARITSLFSVIASKMGLPATQPLGLMYLQTGSGVAAQPVSPANSGVSERRVRVRLDSDCAITLDGTPAELAIDHDNNRLGIRRSAPRNGSQAGSWLWGGASNESELALLRSDEEEAEVEWVIKRAHWRLRVEPIEFEGERRMQVVLCGVKVEAFSVERTRNAERGFLGG